MKRPRSTFFLLLLFGLAATLRGEVCSLDTVPAATLLLPYFEVDLANPAGRTTLISIANASDRPTLAHVVLWTDVGIPTLAFDVYLTGFDVQTLNFRDLFAGNLPATADAAGDPGDALSPVGEDLEDVTFPGCQGLLPPQPLTAEFREHLRRAHLGLPSPVANNACLGLPAAGQRAHGYATVDVVQRCSTLTPADGAYYGTGGVIGHDNVLWGEFFLIDPAQSYAQGENLVRIESAPGRFIQNDRTFYGRFVQHSGIDGREPLPVRWGVRFINGGIFDGGTDLIVWRQNAQRAAPFSCGSLPAGAPLPLALYGIFNEEEEFDTVSCFFELCSPFTPFPGESGRYPVSSPAVPVPFNFGWLFLDLQPSEQAWVGSISSAQGQFSVGLNATPMTSSCGPLPEGILP
jgi:hypothetical protein